MIGNTNDATNDVTVSWTGPRIGAPNNVTLPACKNALCNRARRLGSDYCDRHGPGEIRVPDTDLTNIPQPSTDSGPSRRDLQRQLDRLEGKLDAVLAALNADEE